MIPDSQIPDARLNDSRLAQFHQWTKALNAAQRAAIAQPEGPTLVLAGPGTGKTQLIAVKVGTILQETDTLPRSILCLTFTDAGVHALKSRLLQGLGPEGLKVQVLTYHGFCNQIIQQNRYLFGYPDLEALGDLERMDIIRSILDVLPWDHPLRKGYASPYLFERELRSLFQWMKRENHQVNDLIKNIEQYCASMDFLPEFRYKRRQGIYQAGDLKEGLYHEALRRYERLRAGIDLFAAYEQEKKRRQRYDYEDMLLWVLQAFRENTYFLRFYQEQFLYVLLDEFQDTNGAQFALVQSLLNYWDTPNLFVVGDENQSVYAFQGARLRYLEDLILRYGTNLQMVRLQENYRSTQDILNAAFHLIRRNTLRSAAQGDQPEPLQAASPLRQVMASPQVIAYGHRRQEEAGLLLAIRKLLEQGVESSDIAVIYRNNRQGDELVGLFEKNAIPFHSGRPMDILQAPVVRKVMRILRFLVHAWQESEGAEAELAVLLYHAHWELPVGDLLALSRHRRAGEYTWLDLIRQEETWQELELENRGALRHCSLFLKEALRQGRNRTLPAFLEYVLHQSGLLKQVLKQRDSVLQVQILNTLADFAETALARMPDLSVEDFLASLERMQVNRLPLHLEMPQSTQTGVQLLTAHRSKGLEFGYVFLYDCIEAAWEGKSGSSGSFSFPPSLLRDPEEDETEAGRRLFYVALTRASRFLQISYSERSPEGKSQMPSMFVSELIQDGLVREEKPIAVEDILQQVAENRLRGLQLPATLRPPNPFIEERLEAFALSISALNRYLDCPLSFYYRDILGIQPSPGKEAIFGTLLHEVLAEHATRQRMGRGQIALGELFEKHFQRKSHNFPPAARENFRQRGLYAIAQFDASSLPSRDSRSEWAMQFSDRQGNVWKGVIDLVDYLPGARVRITDYKTGRLRKGSLSAPTWKGSNPFGGIYWRQMAFYRLLFEGQDHDGFLVSESQLVFLEEAAGSPDRMVVLTLGAAELSTFRQKVGEVFRQIQARDFYRGCGQSTCLWCRYLQDEILPDWDVPEESLLLDDGRGSE